MKRSAHFLLGILVAIALPCSAAWGRPAEARGFAAKLDELVAELLRDFGKAGVAVAVIEKGRVTSQRFYGYADTTRRIPVSSKTLFNAASVSKAVSAFGVLRLVDKRRIGLNDPVFSHISRWQLPPSEFPVAEATVARLLSHTGGISRHTTGTWQVGQKLPTLEAALSGDNGGYGDTRLIYQPGTKWSYSGGGYSILQMLVEETARQPFSTYMNNMVLRPLGMARSRYGWPAEVTANLAVSYDEFGAALADYRSVEEAAGALNVSIGDLARFATVFAPGKPRGGGVVSPALIRQMITAQPGADLAPSLKFGLGVSLQTLADGRELVWHDGGNPGWGGIFMIEPKTGNGIAVLVNRSWAGQIFFPITCAWQNATAAPGTAPKACNRDLTGIVVNVIATQGREAARQRYEKLRVEAPERLNAQQMMRMSRQLFYAGRTDDAAAVLRWHLAHEPSAAAVHDRLGDVLQGAKDIAGARAAWIEALRLDPKLEGVKQKLDALPAS